MKTVKFLMLCLILFITSSCENPFDMSENSRIVGTWDIVRITINEQEKETNSEKYHFKPNGNFKTANVLGIEYVGEYALNDDKLTIVADALKDGSVIIDNAHFEYDVLFESQNKAVLSSVHTTNIESQGVLEFRVVVWIEK